MFKKVKIEKDNFKICNICDINYIENKSFDCNSCKPMFQEHPTNFVPLKKRKDLTKQQVDSLLKDTNIAVRVNFNQACYLSSILNMSSDITNNIVAWFRLDPISYIMYSSDKKEYILFMRTQFEGEYSINYMSYSYLEEN